MDRKVKIMGIINLNDDSFYSGSRCPGSAFGHRLETMLNDGADIIDLGAVSSRPGAAFADIEEEWRRLREPLEIIKGFHLSSGSISIDTFRSEIVERAASLLGDSFIINDISAGTGFVSACNASRKKSFAKPGAFPRSESSPESNMLEFVGKYQFPYIAMHIKGTPQTMQALCNYPNGVVNEVKQYFADFEKKALAYGIRDFIIDPGFGFAKTIEQNWELFNAIPELKQSSGKRILVGISRKSMIYKPLGITPEQSLEASVKANIKAAELGADILRVHDIVPTIKSLRYS